MFITCWYAMTTSASDLWLRQLMKSKVNAGISAYITNFERESSYYLVDTRAVSHDSLDLKRRASLLTRNRGLDKSKLTKRQGCCVGQKGASSLINK